jgi:3-isopropylmalate dehydrogenase
VKPLLKGRALLEQKMVKEPMVDGDARRFKVALLPGDGIGPEVLDAALSVLRAVESRLTGVVLEFEEFSVGAEEFLSRGDPFPPAIFESLPKFDAILLGAMGLPAVRWPNGIEMTPQLDLREQLDLYCGLRPIYLFHSQDSPLRDRAKGSIDLLLVRESTEGLFSSRKNVLHVKADSVEDQLLITRKGSERIIRAAFRQALRRRRHLTLVDKANVLPSMAFFRQIFDEIAPEFPEVETERLYVDAVALYLVQKPEIFDVMVTENMFGDILSDLAAGLVGGMGMAPSADLGDEYAVFQPSHGSAPDIAGKGVANPVATILSAAMMLEWLGHAECRKGADMIRASVRTIFSDPKARTRDMGGKLSTCGMADAILEALSNHQAVGKRQ